MCLEVTEGTEEELTCSGSLDMALLGWINGRYKRKIMIWRRVDIGDKKFSF